MSYLLPLSHIPLIFYNGCVNAEGDTEMIETVPALKFLTAYQGKEAMDRNNVDEKHRWKPLVWTLLMKA